MGTCEDHHLWNKLQMEAFGFFNLSQNLLIYVILCFGVDYNLLNSLTKH